MKNEWTEKADQKIKGTYDINPKSGFAPNFGQYSFKFQFDDDDPVEVSIFSGQGTVTMTIDENGSLEFRNGDKTFKIFVEEV